ncbi:MAG: cell wall hydrolase [Octadecabacter sp.]|nr:cell wall hydrolase [Octadecabacter sp.]
MSLVVAALSIIITLAAVGGLQADGGGGANLITLFGQEKLAIQQVPSDSATVSSVVMPSTASYIPIALDAIIYDKFFLASQPTASGGEQWRCLTEALYFEARGENVRGLFAVGEVIMNRRDSVRYPSTLCGVINQGTGRQFACQFTYTCDGASEQINEHAAWKQVGKVARILLDGSPRELTNGATHYHTTAVNPRWASIFPRTASIGSHYFYREG